MARFYPQLPFAKGEPGAAEGKRQKENGAAGRSLLRRGDTSSMTI